MIILAIAYLVLCGFAYPLVLRNRVRKCAYTEHQCGVDINKKPVFQPCEERHRGEAIFYSLGGPFIIPFVIGSFLSPQPKSARIEQQRAAEVQEAKHRKKLAEIEAETTRVLEQALKEN